jgi:ribA/ribD-fused uncharacterized protein
MIKNPGDVKRFGRNKISLRKDWVDIKLSVMEWAVREKFKNESLKEMLLSTGDEELIEGNSFNDVYWGVCQGQGLNYLGKILMKIRAEINSREKKPSLEDILFPRFDN